MASTFSSVETSSIPSNEPLVRLLLASGKHLSAGARSQIMALGDQAIPQLLHVLTNPALANRHAPGEEWAPIHAARLLGDLRATPAIEPMLAVLYEGDGLEPLSSAIMDALQAMGPAALEPLLRVQARFDKADQLNPINMVLAKLGVRDPRIFAVLVAGLKNELSTGASNLAEYGDPAGLPHLVQAFDEYPLTPTDSLLAHHAIIELTCAIEELGGELTPAQQAKARAADAPRRRFAELLTRVANRMPAAAQTKPKVGRNDPCPCGSGKKYKKCHLLRSQ
jgi:hypothetical protein